MKYVWILLFMCASLSTVSSQHQEIFIQVEISLVYGLLFNDANTASGELLDPPMVDQILPVDPLIRDAAVLDPSSSKLASYEFDSSTTTLKGSGLVREGLPESRDFLHLGNYALGGNKPMPNWLLPAENAWTGKITHEFLLPTVAGFKISF